MSVFLIFTFFLHDLTLDGMKNMEGWMNRIAHICTASQTNIQPNVHLIQENSSQQFCGLNVTVITVVSHL